MLDTLAQLLDFLLHILSLFCLLFELITYSFKLFCVLSITNSG
jgi:hypothetical protein